MNLGTKNEDMLFGVDGELRKKKCLCLKEPSWRII